MEANQYLEFLGYNTNEYQILSEEEVTPYFEFNHRNYVYAITDPRGKKLFGKNAKIVSTKWKNEIDDKHFTKRDEVKDVPAPPPIPTPSPIAKEEVELSPLLATRIHNLVKKGFKDMPKEKQVVAKDGEVLPYAWIEDAENKEYTALIRPEVKEEVVAETKTDTKFNVCSKHKAEGEWCKEQCKFCGQEEDEEMHAPTEPEIIEEVKPVIEVESFDGQKETIDVIQNKEENNLIVEQEKELKNLQEALREITASKRKLQSNYNLLLEDNANQVETIVQLRDKVSALRKNLGEEMNKIEYSVETNNVIESNFFRQLEDLSFDTISIGITKLKDDKMSVLFRPVNNSGDSALDSVKAISVSGTAKDLDNSLIEAVTKPIEVVYGLMTNAKEFIEETKKLEANTKKKKAEQDKIKKLVEAAKKYHDKEDFDPTKKANVSTATKKWNEILELDKDNKDALAGIEKLKEQTSNEQKTIL